MSIAEAVEVSVAAMAEEGSIDPRRHAAPIEVLRKLASVADAVDASRDNVTMPTLIKCMTAMGMMPGQKAKACERADGGQKRASLVEFKKHVPSLRASDG